MIRETKQIPGGRATPTGLAGDATGHTQPVTRDGARVAGVDAVFDNRTINFR